MSQLDLFGGAAPGVPEVRQADTVEAPAMGAPHDGRTSARELLSEASEVSQGSTGQHLDPIELVEVLAVEAFGEENVDHDSFTEAQDERDERPPRTCPRCASERVFVQGVEGTAGIGAELISTFVCGVCRNRWVARKRRTDVCEHGKYELVPCEGCGRTWETIDWPPRNG